MQGRKNRLSDNRHFSGRKAITPGHRAGAKFLHHKVAKVRRRRLEADSDDRA
jgi:hypothetical protein